MNLTREEKLQLYRDALRGILERPVWPTQAPPNREGHAKEVGKAFACAAWASAISRAAIYCLENEQEPQGGSASSSTSGGGDTPF